MAKSGTVLKGSILEAGRLIRDMHKQETRQWQWGEVERENGEVFNKRREK